MVDEELARLDLASRRLSARRTLTLALRTRPRGRREDTPSFPKAFERCDSTVFSLRNSRAAISRLVSPAGDEVGDLPLAVAEGVHAEAAGRPRSAHADAATEPTQLAGGRVRRTTGAAPVGQPVRLGQVRDRCLLVE